MGASKLNRAVVLGLNLWPVLGVDLIGLVCDGTRAPRARHGGRRGTRSAPVGAAAAQDAKPD